MDEEKIRPVLPLSHMTHQGGSGIRAQGRPVLIQTKVYFGSTVVMLS